ncbi:hypothetical protein IL306_004593 [Fusarium sp. DS 682]|nr:hypothetical protein IL306_004593 [Fusarium sp. DS 682]
MSEYGGSVGYENGTPFHFLPTVTAEPNSRREIELRQSSARSHLAKSMHRRKKANTKYIPEQERDAQTQARTVVQCMAPRKTTKANASQLLVTSRQLSMCVIPDKIVDPHTKMLLHYCTQAFWPGFEIGSAAFHIPPFALDYNTLVAQAAINLTFKTKSRVTDRKSLMHYNQAITHISRDITKPVSEVPEQTLYAILSLCGPEMSPDDGNGIKKRAFDPPLAELSWIHVFGSRLLIDTHAKALMELVDLKGGIHTVKYAGFQASFNYMDLVRATQNLVKPHLPVSQLYGRVKETHNRAMFFGHASDFAGSAIFGVSFEEIDKLSELGLAEDIRDVILDMRTWIRVIEAYHHRTLTDPDLSLLAAHRDLIQQRLLATLPQGYDGKKPLGTERILDQHNNLNSWINEIIQTALLIFSIGVTCPITYAPPYHHAARRLQAQLERYKQRTNDLRLSDFLIWLGMLGVLCTEQVESDLRKWRLQGTSKAVVERVAADGASVVINYSNDSSPADELVAKIGSDKALAFKADVSSIPEIEKLVQATVEKFGKIDCVMANAACAPMNDLESTTEEGFDKAFNLNVKGPYFLVQEEKLPAE